MKYLRLMGFVAIALLANHAVAETESIDATFHGASGKRAPFDLGTSRNSDGDQVTADGTSLLRKGNPWLAVMGEFHYSRYPESEWREELLKMKAGGIDIVSSYVFWIHHEEIEGKFDWTGQRDLRRFVSICGELKLPMIIRIGPWDHGEVRNGGFPDWLLKKGFKVRTSDPRYLAEVRILYSQIAEQLKGLLWKDGGPVIGIQVENEYSGRAEHLVALKQMAREVGLDVPLYTRTGWPNLKTAMPFGEILPMFGGYAEGFWDRVLTPMPGNYWKEFVFAPVRTDTAVGTDQLGARAAKDEGDVQRYPYLTCELGGGMASSYHRRIRMGARDVESLVQVKIGSGSNLAGYYMYHGGTNPDGQLTTLQESQESAYPNDLPVKTYDFLAPLGEFGQERESYHRLRRLHLFLHDFGAELTGMPAVLPEKKPAGKADVDTLRWSVRSDGQSGFLFVNNYQRLQAMPEKGNVQFEVGLNAGKVKIPREAITVPADSSFFWPINLELGGAKLIYSTAQPVCKVAEGGTTYVVFAETKGVPPEFVFDSTDAITEASTGKVETNNGQIRFSQLQTGDGTAIRLRVADKETLCIILLDEKQSLACWKGSFAGRDRIFLTDSAAIFDGGRLRLQAEDRAKQSVAMLPAPATIKAGQAVVASTDDGVFHRFDVSDAKNGTGKIEYEQIQPAGPAREVVKGKKGVAQAPSDGDFAQAAVWKLKLPANIGPDSLIRINYKGDVARVELDGKLLTDNFYNGTVFDVGVRRFFPQITQKELVLKILPLSKDAPIYMGADALPDFGEGKSIVQLKSIEVVGMRQVELSE